VIGFSVFGFYRFAFYTDSARATDRLAGGRASSDDSDSRSNGFGSPENCRYGFGGAIGAALDEQPDGRFHARVVQPTVGWWSTRDSSAHESRRQMLPNLRCHRCNFTEVRCRKWLFPNRRLLLLVNHRFAFPLFAVKIDKTRPRISGGRLWIYWPFVCWCSSGFFPSR